MKIVQFDLSEGGRLAGAYNEHIVEDGVPHCWAVTEDEFAGKIRCVDGKDRPDEHLCSDALFACEEAGRVTAFCHAAAGELKVDGDKKAGGFVRFLSCARGHRPAAAAVLDAAEEHLRGVGAEPLFAFQPDGGMGFYHLGFSSVSDRASHVRGILGRRGYEPDCGEIFMARPSLDVEVPAPPDASAEITVNEKAAGGENPDVEVTAKLDAERIGACSIISAGNCSRAPEAQRSLFVQWLGVEEPHQGAGWGRFLLMKAIARCGELGYERGAISTDWRNFRALAFYTNYGFRVTDTVYGLARKRE